ncbi:MAG: heavy metal translocating P-type ATPase, partial [Hydrogenophaga sp.]|nr:heavy metal translocating P-type ATPase [Hydrogenophaga sp.]
MSAPSSEPDHTPSTRKCGNAEHRHEPSQVHDHQHAQEQDGAAACCAPAPISLEALRAPQLTSDGVRTAIRILQMDCPTEEALIRKKLDPMTEVRQMDFNL